MQLLDRRTFMALSAATAATTLAGPARAANGRADIFTADLWGAAVDSAIIVGEESAVLIDAQLTVPNANRLADVIAATGKTLETICITHVHPDHHLGLAAIMDRFPDAKPVAHPLIQSQLSAAARWMLSTMSQGAEPGTFADRVVVPAPMTSNTIILEGERIEVLEPMHGDTDLLTAVHIPALDTLIASDFLYSDTHQWMAENTTPERLARWRASLDQLEAIGAGTIVPGHEGPGAVRDSSIFGTTRAYIDQWEAGLAETSNAEDLKASMLSGNEEKALEWVLDSSVAAVYPS
ncbi:MBL fold metallo-hydrolase [Roseibium alexandrii]|uniref:Zn-dependent hydrolase, including glyoxylase n=1 Tax=Roseibium alexandrii (strain DSM 17067 / NCIMB 14079 / DFL-11) TaxID=244592 RepID=A0A5E8H1A5_ROSAD|nr:MBL fold metallo-hydrolase [Roseibium alexandrii]EEE46232.1 Zn-dependent hydrolase, including glyoxylase [Roseibium alexandrii DFL-11]